MDHCDNSALKVGTALTYDLGTFEGFNFRLQSAIDRILTADEVIGWDHDQQGEAEFWPSGDNRGVSAVFAGKTSVTASELVALNRFLDHLGGDSEDSYLRIYHALSLYGDQVAALTTDQIDDDSPHIFTGPNFTNLRRDAAYDLFELYYPEAYAVWEKSCCDGLIFDTDRFLDSPSFAVEEVDMGDLKALIVTPQ